MTCFLKPSAQRRGSRSSGLEALNSGASPFGDLTLKPFPVRAAIDIGSGGLVSLIVARIDRRHDKIRDVLHQTSLPIHQDARPPGKGQLPHLSEKSWTDIINKMHVINGVLKRDYGVVERAAVMTAPLCLCANARELAQQITKEFKVNVRLLQDSIRRNGEDDTPHSVEKKNRDDLQEAMSQLAFEAYACQAQTANRHRLVVLAEDMTMGQLSLVGSRRCDVDTASEEEELSLQASPVDGLFHHALSLSSADAHRVLISHVQRRDYKCPEQSPNPATKEEFGRCVTHYESMLNATVPSWAREKIAAGGVLCGTSFNGGLLNTAARVAGHVVVTVDKIEVAAMYHYCGLTDVLLAHNYPHPHLIVAQAALASAVLRSLRAPRLEYLPSVTLASGILTDERYWTSKARFADLSKQRFFKSSKFRTFPKPLRQEDKSAPAGSSAKQPAGVDPFGFRMDPRYSM